MKYYVIETLEDTPKPFGAAKADKSIAWTWDRKLREWVVDSDAYGDISGIGGNWAWYREIDFSEVDALLDQLKIPEGE
jgi:hypothetical protein